MHHLCVLRSARAPLAVASAALVVVDVCDGIDISDGSIENCMCCNSVGVTCRLAVIISQKPGESPSACAFAVMAVTFLHDDVPSAEKHI